MLAELHARIGPLSAGLAARRARGAALQRARRLAGSLRRPANLAFLAVLALVAAGWWVTLRPTSFLGGSASFLVVKGTSMLPTLHTGDLVLAEAQPSYRAGDLVVYAVPRGQIGAGDELIHRIVGGSATAGFVLKGDNNPAPDPWTVPAHDILGKEALIVPGAGRWLLVLRTPLFAGLAAAVIAAWLVLSPPAWIRRRAPGVAAAPIAAAVAPVAAPEVPAEPVARPAARTPARPAARRATRPRAPAERPDGPVIAPPRGRRRTAAERPPAAGSGRGVARHPGGRPGRGARPQRPPAPRSAGPDPSR